VRAEQLGAARVSHWRDQDYFRLSFDAFEALGIVIVLSDGFVHILEVFDILLQLPFLNQICLFLLPTVHDSSIAVLVFKLRYGFCFHSLEDARQVADIETLMGFRCLLHWLHRRTLCNFGFELATLYASIGTVPDWTIHPRWFTEFDLPLHFWCLPIKHERPTYLLDSLLPKDWFRLFAWLLKIDARNPG